MHYANFFQTNEGRNASWLVRIDTKNIKKVENGISCNHACFREKARANSFLY